MTSCNTGDGVLVRFPFTDLSLTKQRPCVVVNPMGFPQRYGDCVLMPLTSQGQGNAALALTRWQEAGLQRPTWVKPIVVTLSLRLLIRSVGKLRPEDDPAIRAALAEVIDGRW